EARAEPARSPGAGRLSHARRAVVDERRARGGVLVAGGGFAGAYVARLLGERGATIVSPDNFMLFTPLLPEAASGTLEPRQRSCRCARCARTLICCSDRCRPSISTRERRPSRRMQVGSWCTGTSSCLRS